MCAALLHIWLHKPVLLWPNKSQYLLPYRPEFSVLRFSFGLYKNNALEWAEKILRFLFFLTSDERLVVKMSGTLLRLKNSSNAWDLLPTWLIKVILFMICFTRMRFLIQRSRPHFQGT